MSETNEEYDYFHFGEDRDDFMMRFVDSTCHGIFPGDGGDTCQSMLPACEASLEHQLDLLTVRTFLSTAVVLSRGFPVSRGVPQTPGQHRERKNLR
jgi:hypothetical protein